MKEQDDEQHICYTSILVRPIIHNVAFRPVRKIGYRKVDSHFDRKIAALTLLKSPESLLSKAK